MVSQLLRISQWGYRHRLNVLGALAEKLMMLTCGAHISGRAQIHRTVSFSHGGIGVIVNPASVIGAGCIIGAKVTLGNRYPNPGAPELGKNVYVGVGACILGGVRIGDNAMIGANAVVTHDVPENTVVAGVPARVIGEAKVKGKHFEY